MEGRNAFVEKRLVNFRAFRRSTTKERRVAGQ
jgi:hypothetical protein